MHRPRHTTLLALLALAMALAGLLAPPMQLYAAGTIIYVDANASGVYAPLGELLAAPFRVTVISQL